MKSLLIIAFTCILLTSGTYTSSYAQQSSIGIQKVGQLANISLKPDYIYAYFDANDRYLVWYEGYTHTVFIYNLKKQGLKKVTLKEGRGPHEVLQLSGLTISKNDIIYLADVNNIKLIRINSSGTFLKDIPLHGVRAFRIKSNGSYIAFTNLMSPNALFYLKVGDTYQALKTKKPLGKIYGGRLFHKSGHFTIYNQHLVQVTRYYPYLYVYDLEKKQLLKKIKFDESVVVETKVRKGKQGANIMAPPSKVDILSQDIAHIPGLPNSVLLLAKGKSDNRDYSLSQLLVYNFKKEKFTGTLELGMKAESITVNSNYLFVYSKDEHKVAKYAFLKSN